MSSTQDNNIVMYANATTPISDFGTGAVCDDSDKRGQALIGEEVSFPAMKRFKTSIEPQALFSNPATLDNSPSNPPIQNLAMNSFPFFGAPTQLPPQQQQYPVASAGMMNPPHPQIAGHVAAAAHAAMTAFMAQHMMSQHQQVQNKPQNPMQNLMASYAMMQGAAAAAQNVGCAAPTAPLAVSSRNIESTSSQPRAVSCSSSPSGNINAHSSVLIRDTSMQSVHSAPMKSVNLPLSQHKFPTVYPNAPTLKSASNVSAIIPSTRPSKITVGPMSSSMQQSSVSSISSASPSKVVKLAKSLATNPFLNMRDLSLEELEEFVRQLEEANQPIPQPLSMLLTDARHKEKKKNAKRVANRRSACTSRARKKAYVEEMEMVNRKLRRQALILSLLPDLVVAITSECEISFISAQVERVLKYDGDDLIGANMMNLLVPASREALRRLVNNLLVPEGTTESAATSPNSTTKERCPSQKLSLVDHNSNPPVSSCTAGENVISDESFPPSVVQGKSSVEISEDNSIYNSGSGNDKAVESSVTCSRHLSSNSNNSSYLNTGIDGNPLITNQNKKDSSGSDDSSSDSKNLRKASEALNRNVLLHNVQRHKDNEIIHPSNPYMDDVNGATVTANNADARLSSLQHRPSEKGVTMSTSNETAQEQVTFENLDISNSENSSDDSGYGVGSDSFHSREDNSSFENDEHSSVSRKFKPLAPTCTVCLVRMDLTTVWCEVTASIRTNTTDIDNEDSQATLNPETNKSIKDNIIEKEPIESTSENIGTEVKEVLLCLRPLRDGDKVGPELRFNISASNNNEQIQSSVQFPIQKCQKNDEYLCLLPSTVKNSPIIDIVTNGSDNVSSSLNSGNSVQSKNHKKQKSSHRKFTKGLPHKKRKTRDSKIVTAASLLYKTAPLPCQQHNSISLSTSDTEKSVVESLMLMCNKAKV